MTTIRMRFVALIALLAVLAAACGGAESDDSAADTDTDETETEGTEDPATDDTDDAVAADGEPIRVGTILSVTGPIANVGDKMRRGIELAIQQINAEGGIDGRLLEQVFYDAAGDTATLVTAPGDHFSVIDPTHELWDAARTAVRDAC